MRYIINKNIKNYIINDNIKYKKVNLIGEKGEKLGIFSILDAIKYSNDKNKDLVLIDKSKFPPICKIINYKKYIYNKNKYFKNIKKKQRLNKIKEIQIRQNIDNNDYVTKINKINSFLVKKYSVKIILKFKGREITHSNIAFDIFNNIKNKFVNISKIDFISNKIENRQIVMIMSYKKNK